MFIGCIIGLLSSLYVVLATPNITPIIKHQGTVKPNSYIVKLKDTVSKDSHLKSVISNFVSGSKVQYKYGDIFHGYAINLRGEDLDYLRKSKDVEYILEDGIITINYWSEDVHPGADSHKLEESLVNRASCGAGVDIYGIDTGIYTAHTCFGGRARWGATFGGYANQDGNGHGTHTAGIAAGNPYGVAWLANLVAVKALSDSGSGAYSDIISAVNFVCNSAQSSGRPSIVLMSLGGSASTALDSAVAQCIQNGVHFVIAAGNSNIDASSTSPARVAAANTVGAVDSSYRKASFSNYGSVLDVWALGVNVRSAWIGSTTATNTISGTSMAAPVVAGILACALSEYGNMTPAALSASLKSHARAIVTGQPSGTTNLLVTQW